MENSSLVESSRDNSLIACPTSSVNCQVQLFLDNMVLANQNAKLTGPDQGFLVSPLVLIRKPWERGWFDRISIAYLCYGEKIW
jgi:hypothetical protein